MRIVNAVSDRPQYYDRNSSAQDQWYSQAAQAPAGNTDRWVYTVPTGKSAYLESVVVNTLRITAGAPVGQVQAAIRLNAPAGVYSLVTSIDNTVNARYYDAHGLDAILKAGALIKGQTMDLSTGGTVNFDVAAKLTEFDA